MKLTTDEAQSLRYPDIRIAREAAVWETHVGPLNSFVRQIRQQRGAGKNVPYFDPADGGVNARCLFLLEAPGPQAVESGFVSRNNPDPTAGNFFELNKRAGLARESTVTWNVVPWYIGSGGRIRPASAADIRSAEPYLTRLLGLLPNLSVIVLVGRKAQRARGFVSDIATTPMVLEMPHPGPRVFNTRPDARRAMLQTLRKAARLVSTSREADA